MQLLGRNFITLSDEGMSGDVYYVFRFTKK
nr:MAG TPA: hypothetical protein [Caudoviricetes sp.]